MCFISTESYIKDFSQTYNSINVANKNFTQLFCCPEKLTFLTSALLELQ